ncbi:MAG TPA: SLC13 family permease [Thermoanaerobaculia bacterium]|nr:SLC13 family permease [Thermoanaerobaculia bacterium]
MTFEILLVLAILAGAVACFATERLPVDLVALLVLSALLAGGILTPEQAISGFSNTATVTVAAMFVLSAGLARTGVVKLLGRRLATVGRLGLQPTLIALMVLIGVVSAFINNTAAVAIFLPIVLGLARDMRVSPSKLLIPLSFASMFGGVCTLIGTSTNILVSSIAEQHGQAPFGMFELAPLGLVLFAVGVLYLLTAGMRLIPDRRSGTDLAESYGMGDYLTEILVLPESPAVGRPLRESPLVRELDLDVLEILRGDRRLPAPGAETVLRPGDLLRVRCDVRKILHAEKQEGIVLKSGLKWRDEDPSASEAALVEAVIAPGSALEGKTLKEAGFRQIYGGTALAIRHRGEVMRERLGTTRLRSGDVLLVEVRRDRLEALKRNPSFVIVSEIDLDEPRQDKLWVALAIVGGVVASAALELFPIVGGAILGSVLLVLTRCLTLDEAYQAIEWRVVFLLGGILPLGLALEATGAAGLLSSLLVDTVGAWGPVAMVAAFYLLTSLLTETMSNNATAALLAPIAISAAAALGVDPRPFLVAVTFAASASFMTPVGYQTNTLIYGPGHYRFFDFLRVGAPLNLLFWLIATLLIPRIWSF